MFVPKRRLGCFRNPVWNERNPESLLWKKLRRVTCLHLYLLFCLSALLWETTHAHSAHLTTPQFANTYTMETKHLFGDSGFVRASLSLSLALALSRS